MKKLKDAPALLELAIWKSRTDGNIDLLNADMKIEFRTDSLSMVDIIIPNVLSFLTDGDDRNDVVNGEEGDHNNGSDDDNDTYTGWDKFLTSDEDYDIYGIYGDGDSDKDIH
jgi:hypothetical protein